jgi:hypothetical protein
LSFQVAGNNSSSSAGTQNTTKYVKERAYHLSPNPGANKLTQVFQNSEPSKLRQIFPFNPYVPYGAFMSIPMWFLIGAYAKLLGEYLGPIEKIHYQHSVNFCLHFSVKTHDFYSTAYRVDFWNKKPYGLQGYYLHPAYQPVEKVRSSPEPTTTPEYDTGYGYDDSYSMDQGYGNDMSQNNYLDNDNNNKGYRRRRKSDRHGRY